MEESFDFVFLNHMVLVKKEQQHIILLNS